MAPTGEAHARVVNSIVNGEYIQDAIDCRCMIGEDHIEGVDFENVNADENEEGISFPFAGDEEIYDSSGRDEDYDFR